MKIIPLRVDKLISLGDDLIEEIKGAFTKYGIKPSAGDVLAITIKIVSLAMGNVVRLSDVKPSEKAVSLAKRYKIRPELAELVIRQGGRIVGGVEGVLATIARGFLVGNAGIDRKNVMEGYVALWPDDPDAVAMSIRRGLYEYYGVPIGILLVDSRVNPLRRGTVGFAVGSAGIEPIRDYREMEDLFGNKIRFTRQNIIDELASTAHLFMGEGREMTPFVYLEDPPIEVCEECSSAEAKVDVSECLYLKRLRLLMDLNE